MTRVARRVQNEDFFVFTLVRLLCKVAFKQTVVTTEKTENKQNTHVWPHCVVTGLSKISRQTGQTNSDTSLLPSEAAFLCCAALKPPSIAISFLHGSGPPVMTSPVLLLHTRESGVIDDSPTMIVFLKRKKNSLSFDYRPNGVIQPEFARRHRMVSFTKRKLSFSIL